MILTVLTTNYVREEMIFDLTDKTALELWRRGFCFARVESENHSNFLKNMGIFLLMMIFKSMFWPASELL